MKVQTVFLKFWQRLKKPKAKPVKTDQEKACEVKVENPLEKQISNPASTTDTRPTKIDSAVKEKTKAPKKAAAQVTLNSDEQILFEQLKSLRSETAGKMNKPAYYVFSDATLMDMIAKMPKNKSEMLDVTGVGDKKFASFGSDFLKLINNTGAKLNPNEQVLLERLKSLRMEFARKMDKPAYFVFSDATLYDMIAKIPKNKSEMLDVHGVGDVKFTRFGEDFLNLILNRTGDSKIELKPPRALENINHYDYLIKNIEASRERLVIMSGWITKYVVDDAFLQLIRKKLAQGVKIYIGYGFEDYKGNHKEIGGAKEVLISLKKLMKAYPAQLFIARFATHEKLLLVDSKSVVVGSANWLSNKNYINSERSLIIDNNEFVKLEAERAIKLIKQNLIS